MPEYTCDGCGKPIRKKQACYGLKIQLFAAPEVEIDEPDLRADHRKSMDEINEQVSSMDAKKLEEDVYICYDLHVCRPCRDKFSQRIKCREFI
jgi:hypothetical protein